MHAKQIKQLDAQGVQAMPALLPEVKLALQANVAIIDELSKQIDKLEGCLQERVRPSEDQKRPWQRRDAGHHHHAGDGHGEPLCPCGQLQLLLWLRGQQASVQRQEEG
jgi:hypothetical protein